MFRGHSKQVAEYLLFAGGVIAIVFMVLIFSAASVNNYMDDPSFSRPALVRKMVSAIETHSECIARRCTEETA